MKKKLMIAALLGLSLFTAQTKAFTTLDGLLKIDPTGYENQSYVSLGGRPGSLVPVGFRAVALVNITKGDVLVGPLGTSVTARMGVSETATAGDTTVLGIALTSANYGVTLTVGVLGIARCTMAPGVSPTVGVKYTTSATAGQLTPTSSLTGSLYTGISGTPTVVTALETLAVTGAAVPFLGYISKR